MDLENVRKVGTRRGSALKHASVWNAMKLTGDVPLCVFLLFNRTSPNTNTRTARSSSQMSDSSMPTVSSTTVAILLSALMTFLVGPPYNCEMRSRLPVK